MVKITIVLSKIRKWQLIFLGHIMMKKGLKNLILTGYTELKRNRDMKRATNPTSLCDWSAEREVGSDRIKASITTKIYNV